MLQIFLSPLLLLLFSPLSQPANPPSLVLNEILTKNLKVSIFMNWYLKSGFDKVMNLLQFLEFYKDYPEELDLTGLGVVVTEYIGPQAKHLAIRAAVNLDGLKMKAGKNHGIITPIEIGHESLTPYAPNPNVWRIFGALTSDWLVVRPGSFLSIYLTYSQTEKIFEVFVPNSGRTRWWLLESERLSYLKKYSIDAVTISSSLGRLPQ